MSEIVEVALTHNRFQSAVLYEAVRSEGYEVEFVDDNSNHASGGPGLPSKLLVKSADVPAVQAILIRQAQASSDGDAVTSRTPMKVRLLILVPFLVIVLVVVLSILTNNG